ncbi:hypothetical protein HDU92_001547 [Lobulomyces angularis]|nr:hypothetical protein HDU92_001547 [Lobulomyces angularis]
MTKVEVTQWSGFYKKAILERQNHLKLVYPQIFNQKDSFPLNGLDLQLANGMIENCIGVMGLPVGLALNFKINGKPKTIPMVIEEPSVVAGVSGAAKTISSNGVGFMASTSEKNIVIAQVQLLDIPDKNLDQVFSDLNKNKESILRIANTYCTSMLNRGGGVLNVEFKKIQKSENLCNKNRFPLNLLKKNSINLEKILNSNFHVVVHFHMDVCDAMGANACSTVAEGVAPFLEELTGGRLGLRIVSNLSTDRIAKAKFEINVNKLDYKSISGQIISQRIVEAYLWAKDDPYRATTHNKGVMNGIDAVALATGQDWRAIEAASHVYAVKNGKYEPLTNYWVEENSDGEFFLCGELDLPICCGTKGGVLSTNPVYAYNLGMMGNPDSQELAMVLVCVGLAQNFAALRALVSEGIQRGHMSLHASNIAIAAGAPPHAINECVNYMIESKRINISTAREYVKAHALHEDLTRLGMNKMDDATKSPSMFYFEEKKDDSDNNLHEKITLNVAFKTLGKDPVNIEITSEKKHKNTANKVDGQNIKNNSQVYLIEKLLGKKTHDWITKIFEFLDLVKLNAITLPTEKERKNYLLIKKLKLISVLLNIITRRMMVFFPTETRKFVRRLLGIDEKNNNAHCKDITVDKEDDHIITEIKNFGSKFEKDDELSTYPNAIEVENKCRILPKWNSAFLFDGEILDDILNFKKKKPDLHGAEETKDADSSSLILVGLPLLLSIWQVFELRVNQWVGESNLRKSILLENRKVLLSLVGNIGIGKSRVDYFSEGEKCFDNKLNLKKLIKLNSKRFQVTLFLLIDAISLDPSSIAIQRITFFKYLGRHLEWEQTLAHDVSPERLIRDLNILKQEYITSEEVKIYVENKKCEDFDSLKVSPKFSLDGGLDNGNCFNSFLSFLLFGLNYDFKNFFRNNSMIFDLNFEKVQIHEIFKTELALFLNKIYSNEQLKSGTEEEAGTNDDSKFNIDSQLNMEEENEILSKNEIFKCSKKLLPQNEIFDNEKFHNITKIFRNYYCVEDLFQNY